MRIHASLIACVSLVLTDKHPTIELKLCILVITNDEIIDQLLTVFFHP